MTIDAAVDRIGQVCTYNHLQSESSAEARVVAVDNQKTGSGAPELRFLLDNGETVFPWVCLFLESRPTQISC